MKQRERVARWKRTFAQFLPLNVSRFSAIITAIMSLFAGVGRVLWGKDSRDNGLGLFQEPLESRVMLAADFGVDVAEDGTVDIDVAAENGGAMVAGFALTDSTNGTLTLNDDGTTINYTPDANYNGPADFTYTVAGDAVAGTVTINVTEVNDAPTFNSDDDATTDEDTDVTINRLLDNDDAGPANESDQTLTITEASAGNGTVAISGDGTSLTYTPDADFAGTDTITYTIQDNGTTDGVDDFLTTTASVIVIVTAVNDAPTVDAGIEDQTATEDSAFSFDVPANAFADVDGDELTLTAFDDEGWLDESWLTFDGETFFGTPLNEHVGSATVTVIAEDDDGEMSSTTFVLTVENVNDSPTVATPIGEQTAPEDEEFSLDVAGNFADVDAGDSLTFSDSGLPGWLSRTGSTLTGTPTNDDIGLVSITITATDSSGESSSDTFSLTVENANDAPTVDAGLANQTATEDEEFSYEVPADAFADVDAGDGLTLAATDMPAWLSFNGTTFTGTPTNDDVTTEPITITVTASDVAGESVSTTFDLTVENVNDVPTVDAGIGEQSATEDVAFSLEVPADAFADVDAGDDLTLAASGLPEWLSLDGTTFTGTPSNDDVTTEPVTITVTATDLAGEPVSTTFNLTVAPVNDAPTVDVSGVGALVTSEDTSTPLNIAGIVVADIDDSDATVTLSVVNGTLSSTDELVDSGNGTDTLKLFGSVEDLNLLLETGIAYTPNENFNTVDGGAETLTVTVEDDDTASSSELSITVTEVNDSPITDPSPVEVTTDEDVSITIDSGTFVAAGPANESGQSLELVSVGDGTSTTAPANGTVGFDVGTGEITYTPDANFNGNDSFTFLIRDNGTDNGVANAIGIEVTVNVTVDAVNDAPTEDQGIADQTATQDAPFELEIPVDAFADVEGDTLTYDVSGADWLSVDGSTISGTPTNNEVGTVTVTVTADDGNGGTGTTTFELTVENVNDAPTVDAGIVDQTASEDAPFSFEIPADAFADIDAGDSLTLETSELPEWLSFDGTTFSGTPSNDDVGTTTITITATDSSDAPVSTTFDLTVENVNDPPTLDLSGVGTLETSEDTETPLNITGIAVADVDSPLLTMTLSVLNGTLTAEADAETYPGLTVSPTDSSTLEIIGDAISLNTFFEMEGVDYTPDPDFNTVDGGIESLTVTVLDEAPLGDGDTEFLSLVLPGVSESVDITVTEVNDEPVAATSVDLSTDEDLPLIVVAAAEIDPGADNESFDNLQLIGGGATLPENGGISFNFATGEVTYTPDGNFNGADSFSYRVRDNGTTDGVADPYIVEITVDVTVNSVNDTPVATDDSNEIDEDATSPTNGNVLVNDSDVDTEDVLLVGEVDGTEVTTDTGIVGAYGTLTISGDGSYSYAINNANLEVQALAVGETLTESFEYTVDDESGEENATDTATLTITINGQNDGPVAEDDAVSIDEDAESPATGNVLDNDSDVDASDVLTVSLVDAATIGMDTEIAGSYGTLTISEDGSYSYALDNANADVQALAVGEVLTDSFAYTIDDDNGGTANATLTITIDGQNDDPIAEDDGVSITEEGMVDATGNLLDNDSDVDTSDSLTVELVNGTDITDGSSVGITGTYGNLTVSEDGAYSYALDNASVQDLAAGEMATDVFTYEISDGNGGSATATLTVTINGENDGPVANANVSSIVEDGVSASGNLISDDDGFGTDSDVDASDVLSVSEVAGNSDSSVEIEGAYGTLTWNGDGSYTYSVDNSNEDVQELAVGETLTEVFDYTLADGNGGTATSTLTITIDGANDAPLANDDTGTINEDDVAPVEYSVLTNDSDIDASDALAVVDVEGETVSSEADGVVEGAYGTLTLSEDGTFSYSLDNSTVQDLAAAEQLNDNFSYTISDGNGGTSTAVLTIVISGENDDPVANDDEAEVSEDATDVSGNVIDGDGESGEDTDVDASDVLAVTAVAGQAVPEGGDAEVVGTYGTLTIAADGSFTYAVDNAAVEFLAVGEAVTDSFAYQISDGIAATPAGMATLTITINGENDSPVAEDDTNTIGEDDADPAEGNVIDENDSDVDASDVLTVTEVDETVIGTDTEIIGAYGTLTVSGDGSYAYDVDSANTDVQALAVDESLEDSFTYTISDGNGGTASATLTITINGENDGPVATDDSNTVNEDATDAVEGNVVDNDSDVDDSDVLTVAEVDATEVSNESDTFVGTYGTLTMSEDGSYSYLLDGSNAAVQDLADGETLTDVFSYSISDGNEGTASATLTITIEGETAEDDSYEVDEDTELVVFAAEGLLANDDADSMTATAGTFATVEGGSVVINSDGSFIYTPAEDFNGTDSFEYIVTDAEGESVATATITVNPVVDAPVAEDDSVTTNEDEAVTISVVDNDDQGDLGIIAVAIDVFPANGTVEVNEDLTITYTPNADFNGTDLFTYTVADSDGNVSAPGTVSLTIDPVNDAPTAEVPIADQTATEDVEFTLTLTGAEFADIDAGDSLTLTADTPEWLSFDGTTFSGTPTNNDVGSTTITVTAMDTAGAMASTSFELTVENVNDAPTVDAGIADQTATEDTLFSFEVPADAFADVDAGDELTLETSELPAWLTFDGSTFTGTPSNDDVTTEAIEVTVTATDSSDASASTTFNLTVENVNDAPTVEAGIADQTATEDVAFSLEVPADAFGDVDAGDELTLAASDLPEWLSFDGTTFTGTPTNDDVTTEPVTITVTASDVAGEAVSTTFELSVENANDAPTVDAGLANQTATEDVAFSYEVPADAFADVDAGDELTLAASDLPAWLSFDGTTFTGTPSNDDVTTEPITITVTASDVAGEAVSTTFELSVENANDAPTVDAGIANQTATEDEEFSYEVPADAFADVDAGDELTLAASDLPEWLSFDGTTFTGTPSNDDVTAEPVTITVTATDLAGEAVSATFELSVENVNDAPTVDAGIADQLATEDIAFSFDVPTDAFADVDAGDALTFVASGMPDWLSFDGATFTGTPGNGDVGSATITVTATDVAGESVAVGFDLTVQNENNAPTVDAGIADQTATEDVPFLLDVPADAFADIDAGDTLTFAATDLPAWLSFDGTTFSGTPTNDDVTTEPVEVTVMATDSAEASVSTTFSITVENVNDAPTVETGIADQTATEDEAFSFEVPVDAFADVDAGDLLTLTEIGSPDWLTFDGTTFSGTPTNDNVGEVTIAVTATDGSGEQATTTFTLTVENANDAPTVDAGIADQTATEDEAFSLSIPEDAFADVDAGDELSFEAEGVPEWLSFDGSTFSGTPANDNVGSATITVTAMDTEGAMASTSFELTVENVNDAPEVDAGIADQTATEDEPFSFEVPADAFADVDAGDELTFSAEDLPAWLSFDGTTFSGMPGNDDVTSEPITITVTATDLAGEEVSLTFDLTVENVNDAPTVDAGIADQTATEDEEFSLDVPADAFADMDAGDELTFTAEGLPSWLTFDGTTFTGTPTNDDLFASVMGTVSSPDASLWTDVTNPSGDEVVPLFEYHAWNGNMWLNTAGLDGLVSTTSQTNIDGDDVGLISASIEGPAALTSELDGVSAGLEWIGSYFNGKQQLVGLPEGFTFPAESEFLAPGEVLGWTYEPGLTAVDFGVVEVGVNFAPLSPGATLFGSVQVITEQPPAEPLEGPIEITVTATDTGGESVSTTFDLTLENTNDAPTEDAGIEDQTATEDEEFSFELPADAFVDVDPGDELTLSADELPMWLSFDGTTFSGLPTNEDVTSEPITITVTATDLAGEEVSTTFDLTVENVNDAPVVDAGIADQTATEDVEFSLEVPTDAFADVDAGDELTLTADGIPEWLNFDGSTLSGTPSNDDVTTEPITITVTATDLAGESVSTTFDLTVENVNDAPTVSAENASIVVDEGTLVTNAITVDDVDSESLTVTADFGEIVEVEGEFVWEYDAANQLPLTTVTITVDDGDGGVATTSFDLEVLNVLPIVDAGGPFVVAQGKSLTLSASALDPGSEGLSFTWDIDGDGVFEDALGTDLEISWDEIVDAGASQPGDELSIGLRVSDDVGFSEATVDVSVNIGDTVVFVANLASGQTELFRSNGTKDGTKLLKNIGPESSNPHELTVVGDTLFFAATGSDGNTELFATYSDGTTRRVRNIGGRSVSSNPHELTEYNGELFFAATDADGNIELHKSDGTAAGTKRVRNIGGRTVSSQPMNLTVADGLLYFTAEVNGQRELYRSEGTTETTVRLRNLYGFNASANPEDLTSVGSTLFFSADTPSGRRRLHMSDGTVAGTGRASLVENPTQLVEFAGQLYFTAESGGETELWSSDGTEAGTMMVTDLSGTTSSNPTELTVFGDKLFFLATTATGEVQLHVSDGTAEGTGVHANVGGASYSSPQQLTVVGDTLFFNAEQSDGQAELFATTGSDQVVYRVRNMGGSVSSDPQGLTAIGDTLYFSAILSNGQRELFTSDGTTSGTRLVKNLSGNVEADPRNFVAFSIPGIVEVASAPSDGDSLGSIDRFEEGEDDDDDDSVLDILL